jgi:Integrase zinc binding domain/Chromo (CHRromatin Organisation MOdifier) domain
VHAGLAPEPDLRARIRQLLPSDTGVQRYLNSPTFPWSMQDGLLLHHRLVYIPEPLRLDVIRKHHDGPLSGHPGVLRTCELITHNYYFPRMQRLVKQYVDSCHLCQTAKPSRHARHGELAPLPVPTAPWTGLSCDFITDLPVSNGMDSILLFVDRMTKMSHFIPCLKSTSAPDFAQLFVSNVVRLHGLPASIVSDRGSIFTSNFWSTLASILKIDPRKSTAFHPQTDGQTERTNQTLETYLRIFVNQDQDDWFDLLPLAEFAYNNTLNESTRMSPFYTNYGFHPRFLSEITPTEVPAADEFASHLRDVHDRLVENVKCTQNFQARHYDPKHKPIEFQPGDLVWLNATNITTTRPSKKLDWKSLGPFKILKRIGLQAYQLELPITMRHIHDVFHVSLLEPYKSTLIPPHGFPPPLPPLYTKDDKEYFEIEAILDSKADGRTTKYLIKWKGYPDSDNSWEPLANISARALVKEFHRRNPGNPGAPRP